MSPALGHQELGTHLLQPGAKAASTKARGGNRSRFVAGNEGQTQRLEGNAT